MFFKPLDLTTALRPALLPDETLLFVQDAVGLYEGKYKIPNYQNGHAYLTSHRVCYVAVEEPRKYSVGIDLKEVDRAEYQAGFLKSSPKITLYPKPPKGSLSKSKSAGASPSRRQSPSLLAPGPQIQPVSPKVVNATWVCPICSFSNPVPSNFDPSTATASTPIPPCLACGIKPPLATILKAVITATASRDVPSSKTNSTASGLGGSVPINGSVSLPFSDNAQVSCPRCTFVNHPSLTECEICGASLVAPGAWKTTQIDSHRAESPAPVFGHNSIKSTEITDCMKLSFRAGGVQIFLERLKGALIQRKWLLYDAPPVPQQPSQSNSFSSPGLTVTALSEGNVPSPARSPGVGIAGLEQRGLQARKNNELVIGNAFEDLEALMASAKQVMALAASMRDSGMTTGDLSGEANAVLLESAETMGMVTTKDMLGSGAGSLYISELSRNLAEYLTDDRKGLLNKEGGIMSLIDLWAIFNRSRNGVELVSPSDFQKAAELWETLKLPVRLRQFKSGLLVVQRWDWSDEETLRKIQAWMVELREVPPTETVAWDWRIFGRAITAQETAQRFGWSVGIAAEELEMAEDKGVLCREEGIEGLRFWANYLSDTGDLGLSRITLDEVYRYTSTA
ncbi:ESCRT-II subunit protein VPS36 [Aspergillus saccharolyticus JOP 1030-1]|uniref:Vacuolar protein-sorting-associated protein 36 n=1 Tax=Aspergillus saccharolyticus JOP 1030-1 TaxID=1450539 RepID=A0A319A4Z7_9EURO|nr:vacuolar protein sorting protein [Aspergillus saccharolyticus JOP 1030-1]PYH47208.1 vacuolar protein sorting protein [Aspergillus saccharolyticus JOP 1030-1]